MVPVTAATYWYNYGLAVLQQLQDLMRSNGLWAYLSWEYQL